MIRPTIAALLLVLTLPLAAHADDASARAKAEQLIAIEHTQATVDKIAANIASQVDDAADRAAGANATADQKAKVADFKKQAAQIIDTNVGWTVMKPAVVDLYIKNFAEDQLDQILAFYKTSAGAALLEKMPEINTQFGHVGDDHVAGLRDQLQKAFKEFADSLHPTPSLGAPASPAPAAPKPAPATAGPAK